MISEKVVQGIYNFLNFGDTYDRVMRNTNLSCMYELGDYEFSMGIYCAEKRYPRILAEEFYDFSDMIILEVRSEKSYFHLRPLDGEYAGALWFNRKGKWIRAEAVQNDFRVPTNVFSFTICTDDPVMEGDSIIAFTQGDGPPAEENIRELNIHIWKEDRERTGL